MAVDWTARVLTQVDDDLAALVRLLAELIAVPSVTGTTAEHEAQAAVAQWLQDLGLDVDHWQIPLTELTADPQFPGTEADRDEAWGLVGRLPGRGDGPSFMFNGHIDVVPPGDRATWTVGDPFTANESAGRIFGRGACDMKAGLVAAMFAVRALRRAEVPLRGDVLLASVQSEEDGGLGTFATLRRGWRADACVVPEPTGLDIVPANAGALTFRLRVPGRAAHASRRTEGVSAIEKLVPLLSSLSHLEARRNAEVDPLLRRWPLAYPISIGTVRAGDWASTVPDLLVAEGRLGVCLDEEPEQARSALEEVVGDACAADPWLREHPVVVEWWGGQFASGRLPADSDLIERVRRAHSAAGGNPQQEYGAPYGSDLRLLNGVGGIPTLHYGPGDAAQAHAPDEFVELSQVTTVARALALLAIDVCGVAD